MSLNAQNVGVNPTQTFAYVILYLHSCWAVMLNHLTGDRRRPGRRKFVAWKSGRGFLFLALSPATYCPGQDLISYCPTCTQRSQRTDHLQGEASLINVCKPSRTFLRWRCCLYERLLASLWKNIKVGQFFVPLSILKLVKPCFTHWKSGTVEWVGRITTFFSGILDSRVNWENVS